MSFGKQTICPFVALFKFSFFYSRSAGEDGCVLQLDHREKHVCRSTSNSVSLINLTAYIDPNAEAKCIAVNPIRTEYIAVGANDPYARIYDRRMLKTFSSALNGKAPKGAERLQSMYFKSCP